MVDKKFIPLLKHLLEMAAGSLSNRSCNDFELAKILPNVEDRRELMKRCHEWNGDPEEFDPNDDYEIVADYFLVDYFASNLQQP